MTRPITPTLELDAVESEKFLKKVTQNLKSKVGYTPTPKIAGVAKRILANSLYGIVDEAA